MKHPGSPEFGRAWTPPQPPHDQPYLTGPERISEVEEAMQSLDIALAEMREAAQVLDKRLSPVLSPDAPCNGGIEGLPYQVPLATRIATCALFARGNTDIIRSILGRLGL